MGADMQYQIDTRQPAIGSTSCYGHWWDTQAIVIDVFWPGFGWNYAHRLPDMMINSRRYIDKCYEQFGAFEIII